MNAAMRRESMQRIEARSLVFSAIWIWRGCRDDMDFPGFAAASADRELSGFWSVSVSGNWRIIFRFEGSHVVDVDLVDYH